MKVVLAKIMPGYKVERDEKECPIGFTKEIPDKYLVQAMRYGFIPETEWLAEKSKEEAQIEKIDLRRKK